MILTKGICVDPGHENQVTRDGRVNRKGRMRGNNGFFFSPDVHDVKSKRKREGCLLFR